MTNEEIANRLDEAGELIKTHGWWNGKLGGPGYCAVTAISTVSPWQPLAVEQVFSALRRDLSEKCIPVWNDKQPDGQTVIAALHGAATRLRAQGTV